MTATNPFVLEKNEYKRDLNIVSHYIEQATNYLSIVTGKSVEECKNWVVSNLKPGGKFEFKDPKIVYLERLDNGDRIEKSGTMLEFIQSSISDQDLIAPNLTCYISPKINQSLLVNFIDDNVKARSAAKKAMFAAEQAGDKHTQTLKKIEQGNKKISNNSISGGHVSSSTVLVNKTAHSTLTSNCRSTSGYGNANNEKMLSGNRHYWNPNIVTSNIISIITRTDYDRFQKVIDKYKINYPTVEETLECVTYSTNLYWKNKHALKRIRTLISRLSPIQRAAFVYTGDLYHIRKHNPELVRTFIAKLTTTVNAAYDIDPIKTMDESREEFHNLAKLFFPERMQDMAVRGRSLADVMKQIKDSKKSNPDTTLEELHQIKDYQSLCDVAVTAKHASTVIDEYGDFIECFFVTDNVPASLAYFPTSIRRAALTSDTDSTIFTVQEWVEWFNNGVITFDPKGMAVACSMIFLAAEAITHVLARMSANFGIEEKRIHQVAMKNEYYFPVFTPTQVGKHYFAGIFAQEGNIKKELEMEIKGVHLKSSNVPKIIMKQAEKMMNDIVEAVLRGEKISLVEYLTKVADAEREVRRSLLAGESTYFRKNQIKIPAAYTKSAEESPYQYHLFWNEVFGPKYGTVTEPPYTCLKVSVNLTSKVVIKQWIASISDKPLAARLEAWVARNNKTSIKSFLISEEMLRRIGMPEEIKSIMDLRKTIFDISSVFYIVLETLGYYVVNENLTRLISDEY